MPGDELANDEEAGTGDARDELRALAGRLRANLSLRARSGLAGVPSGRSRRRAPVVVQGRDALTALAVASPGGADAVTVAVFEGDPVNETAAAAATTPLRPTGLAGLQL